MRNITILSEKPSQAAAYASAFEKSTRKKGFYEVKDQIFEGNVYITYGFGHLVELAPPSHYDEKWSKWSLETLPIFPEKYDFQVSKDKKEQFDIVSDLLRKSDTIIIATDSDREGENIAWSIIMQAKAYDSNKEYKRLWINSLEVEAIREGFKNLKEGMDFYPYYQEAQARQISDWLIGMNGSPLYTLNLQKQGVQGVFSLGRVQTPTLYMIYKRNAEIENFKKSKFYEIEGNVKSDKGTFKSHLNPSKKFNNVNELNDYLKENHVEKGTNEAVVSNVEENSKKTSSPQLFSLSSLQSKVNQKYKASASDTLKAVQNLYEAKLLTYPRTDTPYITHNEYEYLVNNLKSYVEFLNIELLEPCTTPKSRYVNDKKVQEHHAIVLTKKTPSKEVFNKLSDLEQKIYMLVAKTTVAMFFPEYQYKETVIDLAVNKLNFKSKGQVPTKEGWRVLFKNEKEDSEENKTSPDQETLPAVKIGEKLEISIFDREKETQPPKYYTEGTLITAMKTAGKTLENDEEQELLKEIEGIGTEATRANIIETLKAKEYVTIEKNKMKVTEKGKILSQAVENQKLLTSAEMTAKWESYLKKIGAGEGNQKTFLENIKKFINHLIDNVANDVSCLDFSSYKKEIEEKSEKETVGNCIKCGSAVIKKKSFYGCSNYPSCKFTVADNFRKKKLTKKNLKELLEGKETTIKDIKKADGNKYSANVKLNEKGYIEFISFANTEKSKTR